MGVGLALDARLKGKAREQELWRYMWLGLLARTRIVEIHVAWSACELDQWQFV